MFGTSVHKTRPKQAPRRLPGRASHRPSSRAPTASSLASSRRLTCGQCTSRLSLAQDFHTSLSIERSRPPRRGPPPRSPSKNDRAQETAVLGPPRSPRSSPRVAVDTPIARIGARARKGADLKAAARVRSSGGSGAGGRGPSDPTDRARRASRSSPRRLVRRRSPRGILTHLLNAIGGLMGGSSLTIFMSGSKRSRRRAISARPWHASRPPWPRLQQASTPRRAASMNNFGRRHVEVGFSSGRRPRTRYQKRRADCLGPAASALRPPTSSGAAAIFDIKRCGARHDRWSPRRAWALAPRADAASLSCQQRTASFPLPFCERLVLLGGGSTPVHFGREQVQASASPRVQTLSPSLRELAWMTPRDRQHVGPL